MKALLPLYVKLQSRLHCTFKDEKGATMVEYALMVALIAAVCVAAVGSIGTNSNTTFAYVRDRIVTP